jgi:hypothetical protein
MKGNPNETRNRTVDRILSLKWALIQNGIGKHQNKDEMV